MKIVALIVLAIMVLSFLWSLIMGAIKWAIIIGVGLFLWGALKALLAKSGSTG